MQISLGLWGSDLKIFMYGEELGAILRFNGRRVVLFSCCRCFCLCVKGIVYS